MLASESLENCIVMNQVRHLIIQFYPIFATVSSYASTVVRTTKPFNPLLGETFEADRMHDRGWRCITEQVRRGLSKPGLPIRGSKVAMLRGS